MVEDLMLQLSTAPQLPKGQSHDDADDRGDVVSPPARRPDARERATDVPVGKLSFTLQMVLGAIFATATIIGGFWAAQSGLRSDVRNINTLMQSQTEALRLQRELERERAERAAEKSQANIDSLRATVESIQKEQRLMQIEFQNFRQSMLTIGRR